jgi:hypothetical protein
MRWRLSGEAKGVAERGGDRDCGELGAPGAVGDLGIEQLDAHHERVGEAAIMLVVDDA